MTKEERELVIRLAKYATKHLDEHEDFVYIAYSLWYLGDNYLDAVKNILTERGH